MKLTYPKRLNFSMLVLTLLIFIFASCTPNKPNFYLDSKEEIEIITGMPSDVKKILFIDNQEFLMLADIRTAKELVLYNLETKKIESRTQLDTVYAVLGDLGAIDIINSDSILVLSEYSNQLRLLNKSGEIINKLDLNPLLMKNGHYEVTDGWDPFCTDSGILLFKAYYSQANDPSGNFYKDNTELFRSKSHAAPYLFKVEYPFTEETKCMFGVENFYSQFANNSHLTLESGTHFSHGNSVYISSIFVDTIYEYDLNSLKQIKKHPIHSDYSKLGYTPATTKDFERDDYYHNDLGQTKGRISFMTYDKYNNYFYVIALHEIPIETPRGERVRPWSILIYSENFTKVDEIKMDEKVYSPEILVTSKGILISNYPKTKNDPDIFKKSTFELFELVQK